MKTFITALMTSATVFAGAAQAVDGSAVTREQVVAEMQKARLAGLTGTGELDYPPPSVSSDYKSRSEVEAELAAAIVAGQTTIGEETPSPIVETTHLKTRAQVEAEMIEYAASHPGERVEA